MSARSLIAATLIALVAGCSAPAGSDGEEEGGESTAAVSEDPAYEAWAEIARSAGGRVHPNGWATVIGVRGLSKDGRVHGTESVKGYDDVVIVLERSHKVHRLAASTHPWELKGVHGVPDVNGDGVADVGMIRPGNYNAKGRGGSRLVGGLPAFDVRAGTGTSGQLPGWRDIDHDGRFSASERERSEARNEYLTAVLFHHGAGGAPAAVGCQVFAEAEMKELIEAVGGSSASFNYVLIDVTTLDESTIPR